MRKRSAYARKLDVKNDPMRQPITPHEHEANIKYLADFATRLDHNKQTFDDFSELVLIHRLTFYNQFSRSEIDASNIKEMVEDIFAKDIVPNVTWSDKDQCYKHKLGMPLAIHWTRRELIIKFIEAWCSEIINISDRREYAMICYNGMLAHRTYCNIKRNDVKLWYFIDHDDDGKYMRDFEWAAKKFKVTSFRSFVT